VRITASGSKLRIVLGEVELERWPEPLIKSFETQAETVRSSTYLELAETLRIAKLYIGNDSGPSHLAAVLGVPSRVLFGPTDDAVWRPLGPDVRTLRRQPLAALSVEEVSTWLFSHS